MTWRRERMRIWRTGFLALFLVALVGPWVFDPVFVPGEDPCTPPFIRLERDFCGLPMSGIRLVGWMSIGSASETTGLITGTTPLERWWRGPLISLALAVILLPFFTTLLLALLRESRHWQPVNLAAWALAGGFVLVIILFGPSQNHASLWGLKVYLGLAAAAFILELSMAARQKRQKV